LAERLDAHVSPPPGLPADAVLIAADGSQIFPSRHKAVLYYLINVGVIVMEMGAGKTPDIFVETDLHYEGDTDADMPTEGQVALRRDLAERRKMLDVSDDYPGNKITLTDGQLELWGGLDNENKAEFEKNLQDYLDALIAFRRKEIITAGYVDKPGANWLVRLLEVAELPTSELRNLRAHQPLRGVTDHWLAGQMLGYQERSAVFAFQAKTAERYADEIALHFFYLNVGDEAHPNIARVDIPRWVAQDRDRMDLLHRALVEQSLMMSHKPFPYVLHRAHEIARVTNQEQSQVDQMLEMEIRSQGGEVSESSGKQSAKDLPGRTRYQP
jgi:hypothetical protein